MSLPTHLFPARLLPPEGTDDLFEGLSPDELQPWLAALPSGGPGYILTKDGCQRNLDAGGRDEQPGPVLELFPARPDADAGLELDLDRLDRVIESAWQRCKCSPAQAPADRVSLLFGELSRHFASASADWSLVWSWDSRDGDELEICLRAVTLHSDASPILYHEALPEVAGRSARDIIAAGLLSLAAATPLAASETAEPAVEQVSLDTNSIFRQLGPAPNKKQEPVRVDDSLLSCAEGAEVNIIVDRGAQRAYLLVDGGIAIDTPVSTGARGHTTPLGKFTILEKRRTGKISTIYKCPLPRWMRLTWQGIGMHVGSLPGYPASHGCIRLPEEAATALFDHTSSGTAVQVVANWAGPVADFSIAAK